MINFSFINHVKLQSGWKNKLFVLFSLLTFTKVISQQGTTIDTSITKEKDVIDIVVKMLKISPAKADSTRQNKKVHFSLLPTGASSPGGGAAIVTALNAAFYTGPVSSTSLSTITFSPWFSFDGKFVLPIRQLIWFPNNKFLSKGDTRFMIYPQETWGLGGKNEKEEHIELDYNYVRVYQSLLKEVGRNFFLGAGYALDYHYNMSIKGDSTHYTDIPFYKYKDQLLNKTISSGPVLNFLVDSRRNAINPEGGFYFAVDYRFNLQELGSTEDWQSVYIDMRKYFSFSNKGKNLLGLWSYFWAVTSGDAPYLDLPSIGWDYLNHSGRGFQQSRYRGRHLFYVESEYRRGISRNGLWGFVVFANLHSTSEYLTDRFVYWHPATGFGVRLKFNKISKTNISVDFGFSKDFFGVDLALGEIF
ncbi:MAG TPA: hypothetical protein VJ765_01340 [Chitinophagaceae bacterium]|nr:hypothetical protein [Chitinophagaceae bacterium]